MTLEIRTPGATDYDELVSMLIAGPPGKGKTRFSITAEYPLLLNAEAGTRSIARSGKKFPIVKIDSSTTLQEAKALLKQGPEVVQETLGYPVDTVIIDTIDEVQRIIIGERLAAERKEILGPGDWSWLGDQLNGIVRDFRSLPFHVIFVCHVRDQHDGDTGATTYKLDMSGAIAHQLPAAVDLSLLLTDRSIVNDEDEISDERESIIVTSPNDQYEWLKDRSGTLPAVIDLNFVDDFQKILKTVNDVELDDSEIIEIEVPKAAAEARPTSRDLVEKMAQADRLVEEATQAKREEKKSEKISKPVEPGEIDPRSRITEVLTETEREMDISKYSDRETFSITGDVALGMKLGRNDRVMQIRGFRVVYDTERGKVLSVNELESGVVPKKNPDIKSGVFCQRTGVEITAEDADRSRTRFSRIYCEEVFDEEVEKLKRVKTTS